MNEALDHIGARTCLAGSIGFVSGVASAMLRGHSKARYGSMTAISCAMAATACCSFERLAYHGQLVVLKQQQQQDQGLTQQQKEEIQHLVEGQEDYNINRLKDTMMKDRVRLLLTSHFVGGAVGGAFLGALYSSQPFGGVLFFGPIMMAKAGSEILLANMRDERLTEIKNSIIRRSQTNNKSKNDENDDDSSSNTE